MSTIAAAPNETLLFKKPEAGTVTNDKLGVGTYNATKTVSETGATTFKTVLNFTRGVSESREKTVVKNDDGSRTVSGVSVLPDGRTRTFSETIKNNADGTRTITGTRTNENGKVTTYVEVSAKAEDGTITRTRTETNAAGKATVSVKKMEPTGGGTYTVTGTKTYPNGKVDTITGVETITETGHKRDIMMTGEDGKSRHVYTDVNTSDGIRTEYKAVTEKDGTTTSELDVYVLKTNDPVSPVNRPITPDAA